MKQKNKAIIYWIVSIGLYIFLFNWFRSLISDYKPEILLDYLINLIPETPAGLIILFGYWWFIIWLSSKLDYGLKIQWEK